MALEKKLIDKILNNLGETLDDYKIFIETGTYLGETTENMKILFEKIITIELSPLLYENAKNKFIVDKNIECLNGDSSSVLKNILPSINENSIFFLDAHWSMGGTARGAKDVPLLDELRNIDKYKTNKKILIIIDDLGLFGMSNGVDFSDITLQNILNCFENKIEYKFTEQLFGVSGFIDEVIRENDDQSYITRKNVIPGQSGNPHPPGRMIIFLK